jgi:DUF1680 family protein
MSDRTKGSGFRGQGSVGNGERRNPKPESMTKGEIRKTKGTPFVALVVWLVICCVAAGGVTLGAEDEALKTPVVRPVLVDVARPLDPAALEVGGMIGHRMNINISGDLMTRSEDQLVGPFERRTDRNLWAGEHVGKYLHAATLAAANCHDEELQKALRARVARIVARLVKTQEPDGYLGTYMPDARWNGWDVWVHKYDLIGLLTWYEYSGDRQALAAARKVGDAVAKQFGPHARDIARTGDHVGMASTSILEPIVLLYRHTGDQRYLDFARYLLDRIDRNGPKIIESLTTTGRVSRTANAKAYEMLSNLIGLCELARQTGDAGLLTAPKIAWQDIADHHLYITGGSSIEEFYRVPDRFPPDGRVSETCVSTTWLQLNWQLLRLTGEAKYAEAAEQILLNHLMAAQERAGTHWCYFTPLEGAKNPGGPFTCCASSGPRGIALSPTWLYTLREDGLSAETYSTSTLTTTLTNGVRLKVEQRTAYPWDGQVSFTLMPQGASEFVFQFRIPSWSAASTVRVNGQVAGSGTPGEYLKVKRTWRPGDKVELALNVGLRFHRDKTDNEGRAVVCYGPLALVYDARFNEQYRARKFIAPASADAGELNLKIVTPPAELAYDQFEKLVEIDGRLAYDAGTARRGEVVRIRLSPFASASVGRPTSFFQMYLLDPARPLPEVEFSAFAFGRESYSRAGNVNGQIADEDPTTYRVTWDGKPAEQDWYAVQIDRPRTISRVVYFAGRSSRNGGWFDTSAGKPSIQVKKSADGPWEEVAKLESYPNTTATENGGLGEPGPNFSVTFEPVAAVGIRIVGKPAGGNQPNQAFSSCAELMAYEK